MKKIKFKDLAIAFATNQKVNYYDDERESNQTCRIFSLTEETVSIVSEEYQYDDLSFDKIININWQEEPKQKHIVMLIGDEVNEDPK